MVTVAAMFLFGQMERCGGRDLPTFHHRPGELPSLVAGPAAPMPFWATCPSLKLLLHTPYELEQEWGGVSESQKNCESFLK